MVSTRLIREAVIFNNFFIDQFLLYWEPGWIEGIQAWLSAPLVDKIIDKITGQILDQYFGLNVSESVKQLLLLER